jgi:hypothetical protein
MGIFTSLILLFKGYNIHLISEILPEKNIIFNGRSKHMASQIAAGVFLPIFYDKNGTSDNRRMISETWGLVKDLEKNKT